MTTESATRDEQQERLIEAGKRMEAFAGHLRESGLTLTDLLLTLDTQGFQRLGPVFGPQLDMPMPQRQALVRRSRLYWQLEPLADRPLGLWTDFAFQREWQVQAKDEAFQEVINGVVNARHNRRTLRHHAMRRHSDTLLVDGECIFAFYVGAEGRTVRVRTFDTLEITEVLTNPEDRDEIWYYRRDWTDAGGQRRTRFYRDWDFRNEDGSPRTDVHPRMRRDAVTGGGQVDLEPPTDVWVTMLTINTLGLRGYPLLTSGLDWVRAHREFMRDRSALSAARAQFAWHASVKGTQKDVDAVSSIFEQTNPLDPEGGLRIPRAGAMVTNQAVDVDQFRAANDGASAMNDQRAFRLMALLPTGIPEHLTGDVSTGNLATAEALERPLETMFGNYQLLWATWLQDFFEHLAEWQGFTGDVTVDIDPPSIHGRDITAIVSALAGQGGAVSAYPVLRRSPEVLSMILTDLGLNNVDEVMEALEPFMDADAEAADADAAAAAAAMREALAVLKEAAPR